MPVNTSGTIAKVTVTVVGGGVAGLVAAVGCAEAGVPVRLLEAHGHLGGRAVTTEGPFRANLGPHAFYAGPLWSWLADRDLHRPYRRPRLTGLRLRWRGTVRRRPPKELVTAYRMRHDEAPVDVSLRDWVGARADAATADAICGLAGVLTFDHDPGRLSAAFVWDKLPRILFTVPPSARYVVGGWGCVVDRLATYARDVGVDIETGAKVEAVTDAADRGPVILAVGPRAARELTGDDSLDAEAPRVALLDVGLEARRGDPYLVVDLDEAAFVDRFTAVDPSLAPKGRDLIQASIGQGPEETMASAVARIEAILDAGFGAWRDREVWRRRSSVAHSTGAVDLPGSTWRDRTSVVRGDGLLLCGDWVAAPGHLAEVSWASALEAASAAVSAASRRRAGTR